MNHFTIDLARRPPVFLTGRTVLDGENGKDTVNRAGFSRVAWPFLVTKRVQGSKFQAEGNTQPGFQAEP